MAGTISVEALRARLDKGERITILDVREKEDFDEWRIPGAVNCDAYEALSAGQPGPVKNFAPIPREIPVVAVCYAGNTSRFAADVLTERGLQAMSLEGGMNAWTLAWNTAELAMPGSTTRVIQVRRTGKGCLSYIVGSGREAAVIDPSLETDLYIDLAQKNGWEIKHVLDTHIHADHLSRARALAAKTGAAHHLPRNDRVAFWHAGVEEGTTISVGTSTIVAMRTPGHTPESTCYRLDGRVLFTGDTLFLDAVGRPDLEADPAQARVRAVALHASLQRILDLPANTLVMPAHTSAPVPFDKRVIVAELKQVIDRTRMLALGRDEFVARIAQKLPPAPANHSLIVKANERGEISALDPIRVEAGANRCAVQ